MLEINFANVILINTTNIEANFPKKNENSFLGNYSHSNTTKILLFPDTFNLFSVVKTPLIRCDDRFFIANMLLE